MALESSQEQPQPLGRVVMAVKDWVGRCNEIWVDAQVIEIKRRSGPTQFLTFRDRIADMSASVTVSAMVLDAAGPLPEGSRVTARVRPRVWERNTSLSFECLELVVAGEGKLLARLEQLKRTLQAEGLFEAHRKKRLPFIPRRIGLVTGKGSDAEHDVLSNVARRWPAVFTVAHCLVQGPNSAESVITAIQRLDRDKEVNVIIVARGGGRLEDLLSFSDEGVVRAVANCSTPVISAIGHEQDVPLLDFVADIRASTPTDAAKRVVPDFDAEVALMGQARDRLDDAIAHRLDLAQRSLDDLRSRPVLRDPGSAFSAHGDRLDLLRHRLASGIDAALRTEEGSLRTALAGVRAMSPKATLERGYAVLFDGDSTISSIHDTSPGTAIRAHLADGQLDLQVTGTHEQENHG
ncbi:exodeoxyribonuclease VII large subunit [Tessaracoccus antarcticus]|uniref:Exodeoxyribonuclease 7 large subunit n=1 Tax=Tessaracoccus antarcticus TaxID=2479848 RepID=A0A3M0GD33_9ACTN|nr:exodeoxyribonuclease VII large subunit [Tessaracoccus antarcticus]RMB62218.1 exodeoxyribonuclease VII large subunit [Tessaracoccus antarcticus]